MAEAPPHPNPPLHPMEGNRGGGLYQGATEARRKEIANRSLGCECNFRITRTSCVLRVTDPRSGARSGTNCPKEKAGKTGRQARVANFHWQGFSRCCQRTAEIGPGGRVTSALTPALSPRRGGIIVHLPARFACRKCERLADCQCPSKIGSLALLLPRLII